MGLVKQRQNLKTPERDVMELKLLERPFEVKAVDDDGVFEGLGSVFGNVDAYKEIVAPGA